MSTPSENLLVPIPQIGTGPLVLIGQAWLTTLASVEDQVAKLVVTDADSAQLGYSLQARLTKAGAALEAARTELKAPFLAAGKAIDEAARGPQIRVTKAKEKLAGPLGIYASEQRRIAEQKERERQAELARLEALRIAEEAKARAEQDRLAKLAAEAAAKSKQPIMDLNFEDEVLPVAKTETEKAIEVLKYTKPAPATIAGVGLRVQLYPHIEDVNKLPDAFVIKTAKVREIMAVFCNGYKDGDPIPELPGVRFEVKRFTYNTGKEQF